MGCQMQSFGPISTCDILQPSPTRIYSAIHLSALGALGYISLFRPRRRDLLSQPPLGADT